MYDNASKQRYDSADLWADLLGRLSGETPQLRALGAGIPCPWEDDYQRWLTGLFPTAVSAGFGPHHDELWRWVWALRRGTRPRPFVAIWPRGGGKSSTAELAAIAAGALESRRYVLYVCATQDLADKHVTDIARRLESETIERYYPALGAREVSKYGIARGWAGSRLRTASGFMVDAIGLNAAVRGIKAGDHRPDLIIIDDVDHLHDSPSVTDGKIATLTQSVLPAGSPDLAVLAVQNLIHPDSIFSRLAGVSQYAADFLADRVVSGPHPAIIDLETEIQDGRSIIVHGTALWDGQNLAVCQNAIDTYGETAFRRESQQEVEAPPGGMFDHIDFRRCDHDEVPDLVRTTVWVDPSVTDTDQSDSHGIQVDGVDPRNILYRLWSWEQRASPEKALRLAITKAVEFGSRTVGVETNQGGDLWRNLYDRLIQDMVADGSISRGIPPPAFRETKATGSTGSKADRVGRMLVDYERNRIVHVRGTHQTLERALKRFPLTKPFDLADVAYYSWHDLIDQPRMTGNRTAVGGSRPAVDNYRPR
jgi:hypothetical protein